MVKLPVIPADPKILREVQLPHQLLKTPLWRYIWHSRVLVALSAPLVYLCLIPFFLLDLFISLYQWACFPIYGIPTVPRASYLVFDRGRLRYLNILERLNCVYCSYANGVVAYVAEISARTEQHWCPIKHQGNPRAPHSRYQQFLSYGAARDYRKRIEQVRRSFRDLGP